MATKFDFAKVQTQRQALKQEREQSAAKAFMESLESDHDETKQRATEIREATAELAKRGGTDEQVDKGRDASFALLKTFADRLDQMSAFAEQAGQESAIPFGFGDAFLDSEMQLFETSIEAAKLAIPQTPAVAGEQAAEGKLAEANRVSAALGVPLERVAQAMGLIPEDKTAENILALEQRLNEKAQERLKTEEGLRKEVTGLLKDFNTVADAYARVTTSAEDPSAAGDLSLIFNYMKMLDPNSVVRESEFATASTAGSIPQRIWAQYNRILEGERLSEPQRADFVDRANRLIIAAQTEAQKTANAFEGISQRAGVNPENVLAQFQERKLSEEGLAKVDLVYDPETGEFVEPEEKK